ncbi:MAG: diguanylate cyclase, partial [Ketobacteraceae bacterium]|nr:diguanylate cyclase [Ketobacteraceae bacterium]
MGMGAAQQPSSSWFWVVGVLVLLGIGTLISIVYRLVNARFEKLNRELRTSSLKLREAQRIARMGSWSRDFETGETSWSDEALKVFRVDDPDALRHYESLVHPDDMEQVIEVIAEAYHRGGSYECEHRIRCPDGETKHIRLAGQVFLDGEQSGPVHEMGTVQDITERKHAEESVRQSELKLRSILESAPYPIMIFEPVSMKVLYANRSTYSLFEFPMEKSLSEITDMNSFWVQNEDRDTVLKLIAEDGDIRNREMLMKTSRGKMFWALLSATPMDFGGDRALFISLLDVTEKKLIQEELERLATTDPLTGIFNRRSFFDMANKEIRRSVRYNYPFTLLMMDIDHFKKVNDTYGHAFGDQVIQRFTETVNECLREEDLFGRVGGEEFSVILVAAALIDAATVAERIRSKWQACELQADGRNVSFTVSIGVADLRNARESVDMVMERADKALYLAKEEGRNRVKTQADLNRGAPELRVNTSD